MASARTRRVLTAIGVAVAVTTVRAGLDAPPLAISVAARSIRPGELVVLTLTLKEEPASVVVHVFDRATPA